MPLAPRREPACVTPVTHCSPCCWSCRSSPQSRPPEGCGQNSCLDRATGKMSDLPTVLKFDASGKLVKSFGAGLLIFPHGIHVDKDGNVWVTAGQDDAPLPARGGGRGAAPAG